jgi:hypothetical protein
VTIATADTDARRGAPLRVRGEVRANDDPCEHLEVQVSLRDLHTHRERQLGALATDDTGAFAGTLIIPGNLALGDYEIVARTPGDTRCPGGASP